MVGHQLLSKVRLDTEIVNLLLYSVYYFEIFQTLRDRGGLSSQVCVHFKNSKNVDNVHILRHSVTLVKRQLSLWINLEYSL